MSKYYRRSPCLHSPDYLPKGALALQVPSLICDHLPSLLLNFPLHEHLLFGLHAQAPGMNRSTLENHGADTSGASWTGTLRDQVSRLKCCGPKRLRAYMWWGPTTLRKTDRQVFPSTLVSSHITTTLRLNC